MTKLLIVTDAFRPQVSGVVRTLEKTIEGLSNELEITLIHPEMFKTFPCPTYPEIRLSWPAPKLLSKKIKDVNPDFIHIVTEGPLGFLARRYCIKNKLKFTTAYHTKFPEYIQNKLRIPAKLTYQYFKWFHKPAARVFVATESLENELKANGFKNEFWRWSRGVDANLFNPCRAIKSAKPYALYVGRVSSEKNIEAFLNATTNFTRVVVGDGPQLETYKAQFNSDNIYFIGAKHSYTLAGLYASAAVVVFPSKTDTFGLVTLEALASGTPVIAFNVPGPADVLPPYSKGYCANVGTLVSKDAEIGPAIDYYCNHYKNEASRNYVLENFTWEIATSQFKNGLVLAK
ncbi:MAG: glycosyltransferase family 1 protein [Candidatus Nitrosotenuis sp.]